MKLLILVTFLTSVNTSTAWAHTEEPTQGPVQGPPEAASCERKLSRKISDLFESQPRGLKAEEEYQRIRLPIPPLGGYQRIGWATDVHLDSAGREGFDVFTEIVSDAKLDALVISGDISNGHSLVYDLKKMEDAFKIPIFFVLGNHDYYRSSIGRSQKSAREGSRYTKNLRWLTATGIVPLSQTVAMVGVDGWGDARYGDYANTDVLMNDVLSIDDLQGLSRWELVNKLRILGDESSVYADGLLRRAFKTFNEVVFVTHVPPFPESYFFRGTHDHPGYQPFFVNLGLGDTLRKIMEDFPNKKLTVICGHSHSPIQAQILPNLSVKTGGAHYGHPKLAGIFTLNQRNPEEAVRMDEPPPVPVRPPPPPLFTRPTMPNYIDSRTPNPRYGNQGQGAPSYRPNYSSPPPEKAKPAPLSPLEKRAAERKAAENGEGGLISRFLRWLG